MNPPTHPNARLPSVRRLVRSIAPALAWAAAIGAGCAAPPLERDPSAESEVPAPTLAKARDLFLEAAARGRFSPQADAMLESLVAKLDAAPKPQARDQTATPDLGNAAVEPHMKTNGEPASDARGRAADGSRPLSVVERARVRMYFGSSRLLRSKHASGLLQRARFGRQGLDALRDADRAAPDHLEVQIGRAVALYELPELLGRRDEAVHALEQWVPMLESAVERNRIDPRLAAAACYRLGRTLEAQGRTLDVGVGVGVGGREADSKLVPERDARADASPEAARKFDAQTCYRLAQRFAPETVSAQRASERLADQ